MTHNASYPGQEKELLRFTSQEWMWPLAFMLSMSMVGLRFPLGYIFVALSLFSAFRRNRYDFVIMLTIALGGLGLSRTNSFIINTNYIIFLLTIGGYAILKKYRLLNISMLWWTLYALALFWLASRSIVALSIQLQTIVRYLSFGFFVVPLLAFSGQDFSLKEFWKRLMPYVIIMCIFYIVDSVIFCGNILAPGTSIWGDRIFSTYWDPYWKPFTFNIFRKYPPGLYLIALAIIPLIKHYRLSRWQWIVIICGCLVSFTFTVISGLFVTFIVFQGKTRQLLKWCGISLVLMPAVYFIDAQLPTKVAGATELPQSTLRIKSSIDQVLALINFKGEDDLVRLGSMRAAQAIPKIALLYDEHREWTGFGFLDILENTPPRYVFYNDMYFEEYSEDNWEVATDIEVSILRVFVSIGYIGVIVHIAFFVLLWLTVRRLRNRVYFLSVLFTYIWFGIGDYGGLINTSTLILLGLAYSAVILSNIKETEETETENKNSNDNPLAVANKRF